jgi:hypothetical protein
MAVRGAEMETTVEAILLHIHRTPPRVSTTTNHIT